MPTAPPLVVHVIFSLGTGGLENGLVNLVNRSPADRFRHAIVCLTTSGEFASRLTDSDVPVIALNKKEGHDVGVYWRLLRVLLKLRPQIMHTRNLAALEMHLVGLLVPGVRHVHGEHGRDIYDLDGSNKRYQRLRRWIAPLVDRFITVSQDLRDWLIDGVGIASRKVVQIYNGVDSDLFSPRVGHRPDLAPPNFVADAQMVVGTVGRLAEVKDQATLIEAIRVLLQRRPELQPKVRLVLVGDGPLRAALQEKVVAADMQDVVWMCGDRSDVPELLRMMDVFVLPSLAEGISNTVLEAMATGLPVIATRTGGNPELVEEEVTGWLFPVGDAAALSSCLESLADDAALASTLGRNARARIEQRFAWQRTVDEYLAVYDNALGLGR